MRSHTRYFIALLLASLACDLSAAAPVGVSKASKRPNTSLPSSPTAPSYRPDAVSTGQPGITRFIVKYRAESTAFRQRGAAISGMAKAATQAGLRARVGAPGGAALSFQHIRRMGSGADILQPSRKLDRAEADALLGQLRADPDVVYVQPDVMKYATAPVPNDPRFADLQWDFTHPSAGVGALEAWNVSTGRGTVVAVLDTGYVNHRDLDANIVPGYDFISWYGQEVDGVRYPDIAGDGNGRDADARDTGDWLDGTEDFCGSATSPSSWHGTHVAGTIAAVANNAIGIAGLAHGAKIQPIRVLGHCGGLTSDIADGIIWASGGRIEGVADNPTPAEVINLSLGSYGACTADPATQDAINGAISRGVTVVVAAGNNNMNAASFSPASCAGVITVGATGVDGAKAYYSNYGSVVTVAAPGGNAVYSSDGDDAWIWSPVNASTTSPTPSPAGDVIGGKIGTSMAAPHVAAIAALMQSASVSAGHGVLRPELIRSAIRASVKPFTRQPSASAAIGTGIVDAAAAVRAASLGISETSLAIPLTNRVALNGQALGAGESASYRIEVPSGTRSVTLRSYGGTGDVTLLAGRNAVPTTTQNIGHSARAGNTEALVITNPTPGTYYLKLLGVAASHEVSVIATF